MRGDVACIGCEGGAFFGFVIDFEFKTKED